MRQTKQLLTLTFLVLVYFGMTTSANAALLIPKKNSVVQTEKNSSDKLAQLKLYVNMSVSDYAKLKGHKLSFFEKIYFKSIRSEAKRQLKKYYGDGDMTLLEKIGNFSKGFLFGPIIIPLAYLLVHDENKSEQIKWLWIGFGAAVLTVGVYMLTM